MDFWARSFVFSIPMCFLCNWSKTCFCIAFGTRICLSFSMMPSITAMYSLNVRYDFIPSGTSFFLYGQHLMMFSLKCCWWSSLVMACFSCIVMQYRMPLLHHINVYLHAQYFMIFVFFGILSSQQFCYEQIRSRFVDYSYPILMTSE